jgi:5-formyltetrahydrofolate cyclo-ligase
MAKNRYRDEIGKLRRAQWRHDSQSKIKKDEAVRCRLLDSNEWHDAETIAFYVSMEGEVDTHDIMQAAWAKGKRVITPRVSSGRSLDLCEINSLDDLEKGTYDILEPKSHCTVVKPDEIDLVVVPGIAFDRRGHRIGSGKGYYDRLLKKTKCIHVGLAYNFQIIDYIPEEDFDVPCQLVVTENELINAVA